ncbi:MAG: O-antigen ligase family protein [Crocinitomicaceae bacterium]|nr:O-antigen ligase family protein [Crocinitomicaceae bacterium]
MSRFISQIRFATLVNLAAFISIALVIEKKWRWYLALPVFIWLSFYTYKAQVVNGYVLYTVLFVFTYVYFIVRSKKYYAKIGLFLVFFALISFGVISINKMIGRYKGLDNVDYKKLEFYTPNGNPYFHDTTQTITENGHYVWMYVCQYELEKEWNERASIPYDSLDLKGQPMFGTLMRYLTSKNFHKDSVGVWSLDEREIKSIEAGCTGINMNSGLEARVHSFLYEWDMYQHGADPNGFSFLQRMEHLKAAKILVKKYWLFGCGIGDLKTVFDEYYAETNSLLLPENRLRAHNQFLTAWIATGVVGFTCTLFFFLVPVFKFNRNYFSMICLLSIFISFLSEDMLETQAGATIFALFYSLGIFKATEGTE